MAEVLSTGVIAVLCTVVITTTVLIILYCICRSKDPLHDHTCVAWLHSPRTLRKRQHKYDELPLHDMQNGRKAPRQDKHRTVERLRMEEKKEKAKVVDVKRKEFYERNPEKCPLSIDEEYYYRREPSGRRDTVSKEKERRERSYENQSRSKEYWEPKAKSVHDIYVNEEHYLQPRPQEYSINKQSRSLNFIAIHDEQDGSALYMHPRPLQSPNEKSHHYVYPRSIERNQEGNNHSYSHSLLPRSLEREGRRGRRDEWERHSSSHYVRPRSMEPERKGRSHSSHYERPRSVETRVKEDYGHASSHYVNPKPFKDMTDSSYVNLPKPAAKRNTRPQDKHHIRSKDNTHANENYYQNVSLNGNHEKFVNKSREKAPLLQASEEIAVSEVQQLSAEIPQRQESGRQRDKNGQHHTRYKQEYRDRERMRDAREGRQSRPRSRSTDYRTRSSHELDVLGRSDHTKGGKESYFLPRTRSMISARPPRDDEGTIGRRHTIHLEFHPRSGDVTPLDSEKESDLKRNREYRPREPREFSSKRNIGQHDASSAQQHNHESHARDTEQRQNTNEKSQTEPTIPTRYDSLSDEHRRAHKTPRPRSEEREESFMIPPRYDSLPDRYRRAGQKTRNPNAGKPTLDKHHTLGPRISTESTSSRATMESIHREIQSSSIYKTTDDGRLVLRDTVKEKGTQRTRTPEKILTSGPMDNMRTKRARSPEKNPINGPSDDNKTQKTRTPGKILTSGPMDNTRTKRARSPEKNTIKGPSDDNKTQKTRTPGKIPTSGPMEDTRTRRARSPGKKTINGPSDDRGTQGTKKDTSDPNVGTGTQRERTTQSKPLKEPTAETRKARIREEKPHKDLSEETERQKAKDQEKKPLKQHSEATEYTAIKTTKVTEENSPKETREDTREPTARIPPKRTKSIERVFYVKSIPRSEPTLSTEEPPDVFADENVDWNLLRLTGEKVDDVSEDERLTHDTPALPSLPGQDHKPPTVNNHCEEDGPRDASHGLKQTKPTSPKEIDWHLYTITGKKIEKKPSTTSTKESIRQSLETQIQYGEELHTPSEDSLPRKPLILHFE